jgi:hypothetical protein
MSADEADRLTVQLNGHARYYIGSLDYLRATPPVDPEGFYPLLEKFDFCYMPIYDAYCFLNASNWLFASQKVSAAFPYFVMGHLSHGYFSVHQEKAPLRPPLRTEPTSELEQLLVESVIRAGNTPLNTTKFPVAPQVCFRFGSYVCFSSLAVSQALRHPYGCISSLDMKRRPVYSLLTLSANNLGDLD